MGLSSREVGEALGVSHTAVNKAARRGRIPRETDGTFDLAKVKAVWEKNADQYQRQRRLKAKPTATAKRHKSAVPATTGKDGDVSFFEAQRQREWIRVAKEELELDLKKGKLVLTEDVGQRWGAVLSALRNRLLLVPAKTSPRLAMKDVRECQAILDQAIKECLTELSQMEVEAT